MNWDSWNDFLAMGGYARYVWGAVLTVLGAVVVELLLLAQRGKAARETARTSSRLRGTEWRS